MAEAHATISRQPTRMLLESSEGTPAFRAPETYQHGEHCGRRADIWSLGVTLYVMLFGRLPFPWREADEDAAGSAAAAREEDVMLADTLQEGTVGGAPSPSPSAAVDVGEAVEAAEVAAPLTPTTTSGMPKRNSLHGSSPKLGSASSLSCSSTGSLGEMQHTAARDALRIEHAVCSQPLRFPQAPPASNAARELLQEMLAKEPDARPTLHAIAHHVWVTQDGSTAPIKLPTTLAPLRATPEEIHRAISIRSPALDLATSSHFGSGSTIGLSSRGGTGSILEARDGSAARLSRTRSEAIGNTLKTQVSVAFPFIPPR